MTRRLVAVDFETKAIGPRPAHYPPTPVGVAIYSRSGRTASLEYHSWGHHGGQNTMTEVAGKRLVKDLWRNPDVELVFHNAQFDLEVAANWIPGLGYPAHWHCTLIGAFLHDPNADKLGLKERATTLLGLPPEEQDHLKAWILKNVPAATSKTFGAYIANAPANIVELYAKGDVLRTLQLHEMFVDDRTAEMELAYERECRLVTDVLIPAEQAGLPLDVEAVQRALKTAGDGLDALDAWIRKRLKTPDLDVDKKADLADALERADMVTSWIATKTGKRSLAAEALEDAIEDPVFNSVYALRSKWAVWYRTFIVPWAEAGDRLFVNWNGVRQSNERQTGRMMGARTGRLSSSPNVQNIPIRRPELTSVKSVYEVGRREGVEIFYLPAPLLKSVGEVPDIRRLVAAPRGHTLVNADYSQQELRVLAHYEEGELRDAYRKDPNLDVHARAEAMVNGQLSASYSRKQIKNLGFGIIYGMGLDKTGRKLGIERDEARTIKQTYLAVMPGVRDLIRKLKKLSDRNEPIWTWGGRRYYTEPPKFIDGEFRDFAYKLLNTLVQGSSADITKEACLRYADEGISPINATAHDEILTCVPTKAAKNAVDKLREAMESIETDPAMIAEISTGRTWADCKE